MIKPLSCLLTVVIVAVVVAIVFLAQVALGNARF